MIDRRSIDELKDLGSGKPASDELARLYHLAFVEYGTHALWNRKPSDQPTITQALTIADTLRTEGNLKARSLAVQIEQACRAAL